MPRKTRHLICKYLTSKLQVSPNFTLDSVADSNYRGKCDVGCFLIFEWTLVIQLKLLKDLAQISLPAYGDYLLHRCR
jgi:hypothetical protein